METVAYAFLRLRADFRLSETWCLTSKETIKIIRDGEKGAGGGRGMKVREEGDYIYPSLYCHHQHDSCIKIGSDESHFNVSVGSDGQSHKTVSTNHNLSGRERRAEAVSKRGPSGYQPNALPLR